MPNPVVEPKTFLVIRVDGTEETIKQKPTLGSIGRALRFDTFDFVRIGKADGSDLIMAIDDNGYVTQTIERSPRSFEIIPVRPRKPPNPKATALYHSICKPGTDHQIVGDVAIMHDNEFA
jgi:hypothetical protein